MGWYSELIKRVIKNLDHDISGHSNDGHGYYDIDNPEISSSMGPDGDREGSWSNCSLF